MEKAGRYDYMSGIESEYTSIQGQIPPTHSHQQTVAEVFMLPKHWQFTKLC
jgi:hypothetical protein